MDHFSRRRWCKEISAINQNLSPSKKTKEKSILDMVPDRVLGGGGNGFR